MVFNSKLFSPKGESSTNWTVIFATGAVGDTKAASTLFPTFSLHNPGTDCFCFLFCFGLPLTSPAKSNILDTHFYAVQGIWHIGSNVSASSDCKIFLDHLCLLIEPSEDSGLLWKIHAYHEFMYFVQSMGCWNWLVYKGWHLVVKVGYCQFICLWHQLSFLGYLKILNSFYSWLPKKSFRVSWGVTQESTAKQYEDCVQISKNRSICAWQTNQVWKMTAEAGHPLKEPRKWSDVSPQSQSSFSLYLAWKISSPLSFQLRLILVPGTARTHFPSPFR